ncbi:RNA-binding protein, putative [Bodo saltans]|uniref:RNA-binding protein, putative n=1 Tax=Bodo saltans TaxID=75058 RepID=A0A0S4JQH7_BODSA|nr:RNA-binding protein, putative [Bodo saltans]|eukprot:CUG93775.1 RNA-binding protein, putative [Bodo saltans]
MPQRQGQPTASTNVYVASLPASFTDQLLFELMAPFGTITSARVMCDSKTGQCKGYGFVLYEHDKSAAFAIQGLSGHAIEGHRIQVRLAHLAASPVANRIDTSPAAVPPQDTSLMSLPTFTTTAANTAQPSYAPSNSVRPSPVVTYQVVQLPSGNSLVMHNHPQQHVPQQHLQSQQQQQQILSQSLSISNSGEKRGEQRGSTVLPPITHQQLPHFQHQSPPQLHQHMQHQIFQQHQPHEMQHHQAPLQVPLQMPSPQVQHHLLPAAQQHQSQQHQSQQHQSQQHQSQQGFNQPAINDQEYLTALLSSAQYTPTQNLLSVPQQSKYLVPNLSNNTTLWKGDTTRLGANSFSPGLPLSLILMDPAQPHGSQPLW